MDDSDLVGYERSDAYSSDYFFTTLNAPTISEITVDEVTLDSAVISWSTASLATAEVEYGLTTEYGTSVAVSTTAEANTHTTRLSSLEHSTIYHFRVRGVDADGNDIFSEDNTFTTTTFPKVTAVIMSTDQSSSGTEVVLAWSTNVPTTSEVVYQPVEIDIESVRNDELIVDTDQGKRINLQVLESLSQNELAALPVIASGESSNIYDGKLLSRHLKRVTSLEDGSMYVFTIRGRDEYGHEAVSEPLRYVTGSDTRPPRIQNIIVETPIIGVGSEARAQAIISWQTDEPSYGQVIWGIGTGSEYPNATERERSASTEHVVVIRDLQPTTSYHFKIKSSDETGNEVESEDTVIVTPASQEAAFDIILSNLEDVFGFLKF